MNPLYRRAQRRGLLGGSRTWTAVWALILAVRVARRFVRPKPQILYSARLPPGASLVVSNGPSPAEISR
jgi:hypothetical protein